LAISRHRNVNLIGEFTGNVIRASVNSAAQYPHFQWKIELKSSPRIFLNPRRLVISLTNLPCKPKTNYVTIYEQINQPSRHQNILCQLPYTHGRTPVTNCFLFLNPQNSPVLACCPNLPPEPLGFPVLACLRSLYLLSQLQIKRKLNPASCFSNLPSLEAFSIKS
jgi:hypothetical protein